MDTVSEEAPVSYMDGGSWKMLSFEEVVVSEKALFPEEVVASEEVLISEIVLLSKEVLPFGSEVLP